MINKKALALVSAFYVQQNRQQVNRESRRSRGNRLSDFKNS